jgi:polysaccharide export outer membrane protein
MTQKQPNRTHSSTTHPERRGGQARYLVPLGSFLLLTAAGAWAQQPSQLAANIPAAERDSAAGGQLRRTQPAYRIGAGDVLQVSVWREPEVSVAGVAVRSDGKISLPLIKEVEAAGLTPAELEQALALRFAQFINNPEVTVITNEIHSQKVYLIGGIGRPGSLELRTPMTMLQVLAEAGGLTEYAKRKKIYVLRKQEGSQTRYPFDYEAVIKGHDPQLNFPVQPGDTIVVPE